MDDTQQPPNNVTAFRGKAQPATLAQRSQPNLPTPEAIALLTTCLALVRPVGFTDDNARDWLRVAAAEIAYLPMGILEQACREARRTATHHAQIIPAIIKAADTRWNEQRRLDSFVDGFNQPRLPAPDCWQPTQAELDELKAGLSSLRAQ